MRYCLNAILFATALSLYGNIARAESARTPVVPIDPIAYALDFTDGAGESAGDWLASKGLEPRLDARKSQKFRIAHHDDKGLVLSAHNQVRALLVHEGLNVGDYQDVRITWGVQDYPEGANYDQGVRNEPLMVMIFFGGEKISSGSAFVPDQPYFIGLFLCENGAVGHPYTGRYYKKGGRYVCLGRPEQGETVTTTFDVEAAFRRFFRVETVPQISAIALQTDTTQCGNRGRAEAFLRRIEIMDRRDGAA